MWEPLLDVALRLGVHPRDLARAVDDGRISARRMSGRNYVDDDQTAKLDLPAWEWLTLSEWATANGTYYRQARNMLAARLLDGIDEGPHRRWILQPVEHPDPPI